MGCGNSNAVSGTSQVCDAHASETKHSDEEMKAKPTLLTRSSGVAKAFGQKSWIETDLGMHRNQIAHIFYQCDKDHNGHLTWDRGEIHDFIQRVFRQHGLAPPTETEALELLKELGCDAKEPVDEADCVRLASELFSQKQPTTLPPFQARKSFELTPRIESTTSIEDTGHEKMKRVLSDGWRAGSNVSLASEVVYETTEF